MTAVPDLEHLSLEWLRAKPGAKWARFDTPFAAWVADMDFRPPQCVTDAIGEFIAGGDLGYPNYRHPTGGSPATDAWIERCAARYGWQVDEAHVRELVDVVQGIQMVLHVCTEPGDGVVVHTPAYPPFLRSVEDSGRRVVRLAAQADAAGSAGWRFDYDELERRLAAEPARVLLLCHPHNPTGHVFSDADLGRMADIAARHDLLVISDEIHADLSYVGPHTPMARYAPDRTVTLQAASKAFNLAGVRFAVGHIGPQWVRDRIAALPDHLLGATNAVGAIAAAAAWTHGDPWLEAVLQQLDDNRHLVAQLLGEHLPEVRYSVPDATYLGWLDCRALGWGDDPTEEFTRRGAKLSEGPNFGVEGHGFARLNFATSPDVLRAIVAQMGTAQ